MPRSERSISDLQAIQQGFLRRNDYGMRQSGATGKRRTAGKKDQAGIKKAAVLTAARCKCGAYFGLTALNTRESDPK
jgi:hypothetical protein